MTLVSDEDYNATDCDSDDDSCRRVVDPSEPAHIRIARLEKELAELRGMAAPPSSVKGKNAA